MSIFSSCKEHDINIHKKPLRVLIVKKPLRSLYTMCANLIDFDNILHIEMMYDNLIKRSNLRKQ